MKILKRPDTNWSYKHTCVKCGAELQVEKSDVKHIHYPGNFHESSSYSFTANCAVCNGTFSLSKDNIPKVVQLEITQKRNLSDK